MFLVIFGCSTLLNTESGCIGKKSFNTIESLNFHIACKYLRHPSCGGKAEFIDNINDYMNYYYIDFQ